MIQRRRRKKKGQTYLVDNEEIKDSRQKLHFVCVFVRLVKSLARENITGFLMTGEIRHGTEKTLDSAGTAGAGGRDGSRFISGSGVKVLTASDGGTVT